VTLGIVPGDSFRRIARAAVPVIASALGMPPEQVTVVNAATAETWRADGERGGDLPDSADFLALQQRRAEELQEKAHDLLEATYPGQVRVRVNVQLDPNWKLERRTLTPEAPLVKTDKLSKQDSGSGASGTVAGDPSTTGAVAGNANAPASGGPTNKNETRDREYVTAIGSAESGMLSPDVRRLSAAIVIDEAAVQSDAGKVDQITKLVKGAIGWDETRDGAELPVVVEKFKAAPPPPAAAGPGVMGLVREFGPTAGQVVAVVLVLVFLRGLLRRSQRPMPARLPGRTAAARAGAAAAAEPAEELSPEDDMKRARREIERAIADDPGAVSRLLESWLVEQRN
jgi:flagellar biosynthesis/type III secretory pathway M-ring protein FliF/YscJ